MVWCPEWIVQNTHFGTSSRWWSRCGVWMVPFISSYAVHSVCVWCVHLRTRGYIHTSQHHECGDLTTCEVFQQLQHLQRHGVSSDPQHHTHTPYPSPHPVHIVYVHSGGGCSGWVCGWCPCLWWGNLNISILEISKMMTSLWIISWYVLCRGVQDDAHHASYAYTISLSSPFTHSVYVVCGDLCREVETVSRMLGHPEVGDL